MPRAGLSPLPDTQMQNGCSGCDTSSLKPTGIPPIGAGTGEESAAKQLNCQSW